MQRILLFIIYFFPAIVLAQLQDDFSDGDFINAPAWSGDAAQLFRQDGNTSTSVCRGTDAEIANSFTIGVKVTRDGSGGWSLYVDPAGGTNYVQEAAGNDLTYNTSSFFGVKCVYTTSNAT